MNDDDAIYLIYHHVNSFELFVYCFRLVHIVNIYINSTGLSI